MNKKTKLRLLRYIFLACAVYGGLKFLGGLGVNILYWILRLRTFYTNSEATSMGIIGGADGPTAIFLTAPVWSSYLLAVIILIVGIMGYIRLRKCNIEK